MKTMPRLKRLTAVALASMFVLSAFAFATAHAATVTSVASGGWNDPLTWDTGVPGAADDVTIGAGTTVTINATPITMSSLTVNGTLQYDAVLRAVTVTTNVAIAADGVLQTNPAGAQTGHTLSVGGNLTNEGTLDLSTSANTSGARLTFTGAANNTFSGTGLTTDLRTLTINKGTSKDNILEVSTSAFSVQGTVVDGTPMAFLTITNGTLKISGSFALTSRTFASFSIPANGGFWLNNPNYTVSAVAGNGTVTGLLRMTQGTLNVGTAINNSLNLANNAVVNIEGGTVNVAGRFGVNAQTNNLTFTQTGGVITVCTVGNNSATAASFDLGQGLGPDVVMSGGTVILRINSTGVPARDYRNQQGSSALGISNTVLQFGDAGSGVAKTFNAEGLLPNVVVSNASAGHTLVFRPPTLFHNSVRDLTIHSGCTFNIGNNPFLQRGNTVTNDGTLTANGPSSRFVWFDAGNSTYQGAGVSTGILTSWETQAASLTMSQLSPLVVRRSILFAGNILNANTLTLGDGGATPNVVQVGNTTTPTAAGTYDAAPTFDLGTGELSIAYLRTTASRSTGPEVNPGRALVDLTYDDDDPTHTLTIADGDLTVSGTTALTNGRVITNANKLIANGVVTRTTGYVDGFLQKPVAVGDAVARSFEVGDATAYSPIDVTFASVTGEGALIGKATGGDHAQLASSGLLEAKSVNRNWTLTNSGATFTTADAVFNFVADDIDAGANPDNFYVEKYDAPSWTEVTTGARTGTSTQATGITSFSDFAVGERRPIHVTFDFTPNTLNLKSSGLWVTGYLEPADPFEASQIDIGSILLNEEVPVDADAPTELGDHDGNGKLDLAVKFNRAAVELTLTDGNDVPVTVTGTVDGRDFVGVDHIRVIRALVSAPAAGTQVPSGGTTTVNWQTPSGIQVQSVAVLYSLDGGDTWALVERGLANTGSYLWTLSDMPHSERVKVAVVLVEASDETGYIVDGVLGVSEEFTIMTPVGVGDRPAAVFALRGVTPNPAVHHLRVSFSLKSTKAATLALYDISGRKISSQRVDGLGAGWHTVDLSRSGLNPGVYMIRLTQDGKSLTQRAAFVR